MFADFGIGNTRKKLVFCQIRQGLCGLVTLWKGYLSLRGERGGAWTRSAYRVGFYVASAWGVQSNPIEHEIFFVWRMFDETGRVGQYCSFPTRRTVDGFA